MWEDLGGNEGKNPDLIDVFYKTRKKGNTLPNEETKQKHEEIRELVEKDPSLSHVQVVGFGGGIKLKDIKGPQPTREELEAELNATKKNNEALESHMVAMANENNELKGRMGLMEAQMKKIEEMLMNQQNTSATPQN